MNYFQLSTSKKIEILRETDEEMARPAILLEKDIWVVLALDTLFNSGLDEHLTFKGGTSLSKVHNIINRISEDIDVAFDIRQISELVKNPENPYPPPTHNQIKKWIKTTKQYLAGWVNGTLIPVFEARIRDENLPASFWRDENNQHKVYFEYESVIKDAPYVSRNVFLEFNAKSTGEPAQTHQVQCDIQSAISGIEFPTARPEVMNASSTFWEKLLAVHTFCLRGKSRGRPKYSRHWFDLHCLHKKGISREALMDIDLARRAIRNQKTYYRQRDSAGDWIDYNKVINGELHLVPEGEPYEQLRYDYAEMTETGYTHLTELT